jgi:hypothetical protein
MPGRLRNPTGDPDRGPSGARAGPERGLKLPERPGDGKNPAPCEGGAGFPVAGSTCIWGEWVLPTLKLLIGRFIPQLYDHARLGPRHASARPLAGKYRRTYGRPWTFMRPCRMRSEKDVRIIVDRVNELIIGAGPVPSPSGSAPARGGRRSRRCHCQGLHRVQLRQPSAWSEQPWTGTAPFPRPRGAPTT